MSQHLVIYHAGCWDGFCAAWVFRKYLTQELQLDVEYLPAHHGDQAPDVRDKTVYIVDFCYSAEVMRYLAEQAQAIVVLDHHKTAQETMEGLGFKSASRKAIFDMEKSGARLAWEFCFPNRRAPWLVDCTEDRDLWKWTLAYSKEINAFLRSHPLDFAVWDELSVLYPFKGTVLAQGEAILRVQESIVDHHVRHAGKVMIAGHTVPAVNATWHFSEIGERLAVGHPFAATYFLRSNGRVQVSLRSAPEGQDVSVIAQQFGGGGHFHSAGFSFDPKDDVDVQIPGIRSVQAAHAHVA